jgi:hypothetical protein
MRSIDRDTLFFEIEGAERQVGFERCDFTVSWGGE